MNKTKRITTGIASILLCVALITGSAFAFSAAVASPMETAPTITEARAQEPLVKAIKEVAVGAKSDTEGTPVFVQSGNVTISEDGIVTVSGEGAVICKVGEDGVVRFEDGYKPAFVEGIPGADGITAETAVAAAIQAIQNKYALTDATMARFTSQALFNVANPDEPVWSVVFNPASASDFSEIGCYSVTINAKTGEIGNILSTVDGKG